MRGFRNRRLEIKTPDQVAAMRRAGLIVGETLEALRDAVRPGVTTAELDALAEEQIRSRGARPNFLGYHGFTGSICASVNDEVVHGIPGPRALRSGDVISIDCGAVLDGWHGDAAITVPVGGAGAVDTTVSRLLEVTEHAMWAGIAAARLGGRVGDISHAVERHVRAAGAYGIVEDYVGHGIGTALHMRPDIPNQGRPGRGPRLVAGLALAVEPMVTLGSHACDVLDDDWTVVTADGAWSAHFEHTFALTADGLWVLTALDGGEAELTALGARYGGPRHDGS